MQPLFKLSRGTHTPNGSHHRKRLDTKYDSAIQARQERLGALFSVGIQTLRETVSYREKQLSEIQAWPRYFQSDVDEQVVQYRDWGIPLGRRFRALKLWFHLRLDGVDAIRARIRRDLENAAWLAAQIEATENWQLLAPLTLQTVCVRHDPGNLEADELDRHTLRWVGQMNQSGAAFMTPAKLDGRWMVRVSVGVESTERHHLEALWSLMQATADKEQTSR